MVDTRGTYQDLFDVYWPIGVGVFVLVAAVLAFALVRYRSRGDDEPVEAKPHSKAEDVYAVALVLVVAGLLLLTYLTMDDLEAATSGELDPAEVEGDVLDVEVTAARWNWRFDYPEQGISVSTRDDVPPTLVVPADTPVRFSLGSLDVIHSFFIPELRFKRDAIPGGETVFALAFDEVGFSRQGGECAEYCGLRHAYMDFNVDVKEPADFEQWAQDRAAIEDQVAAAGQPTRGGRQQ